MVRISFGPGRDPGKDGVFLLRVSVVFLFLISLISVVTANPVSPWEGMQYSMTEQVFPAQAAPSSAMEWTQATEHAGFSDRQGHSTVVFNDSLWVIGGLKQPSGYLNDVWRSDDGVTWTQVTANAAYAKRAGHQSVVFNDKIWIIGGRSGSTLRPLNDVWYSSDGIIWTRATSSAPFAPRWNFGITVFDGKIWVLGGSEDGITHNDVWYSEDGVTWTRATEHAGFSPRMDPSAITYAGKMWLTGGFDWKKQYNDVWSSDDGITWNLETASPYFPARRYQKTEVSDGKLWVIGGYSGTRTINDVWYYSYGNSWKQATANAAFPGRYDFTTAAFLDRLWVIGGTTGNDVWYSGKPITGIPKSEETGSSSGTAITPLSPVLVTKTCAPLSIKQGTDAKITITVLNKGPAPVHDIDILDTPEAEFPVVDGATRHSARLLEPDDTIILTYMVHATKSGSFRLNRTAVMYADPDGNYTITYSNYENVRVLPSLITPDPDDPLDVFFRDLISWINGFDPFV
jgi:hypothetical protein